MTTAVNPWIARAQTTANDVLAEHADQVDADAKWPTESLRALSEAGLLGLTVSPSLGGAGQGPVVYGEVMRSLAQRCASTAMIYMMHICGTQTIAQAEQFDEREAVLASVAGGKHLSTLAFSEKGSRSHFWAPVSQASANGDAHHLSAQKSWVTSAGHADSYIVSSRAADAADPIQSTLYYVAKDTPGLAVSGPWDGLGLRGNASAPMSLNDVKIPASSRLCPDKEGFNVMMTAVLPWFLVGSANVSLGICRAALESTRQHLLNSKLQHLGQSLASLMNLRARLAQMQILVDTHEAFLDRVADQVEHPGPHTMLALLESKAAAAEAALQVTDLAMRTCGGASFSKHLTVERNFRDARAGWVMAPTTDVLYDFIGKSVLDMPLF